MHVELYLIVLRFICTENKGQIIHVKTDSSPVKTDSPPVTTDSPLPRENPSVSKKPSAETGGETGVNQLSK